MSQMTVDTNRCLKDGACVAVCPSRALHLNDEGYPAEFAESKCIVCGHCMAVCATGALAHADMPDDAFEPLPSTLPTPEQMDGLLKSRRSIRVFKEQPVSREVILSLLDVARRAPTANNTQKLHWLVIEGKERLRELARETINGMDPVKAQPIMLNRWNQGYDSILRGAPMVVVACAPTEYAWGKEEAAIALAYFEMAAKARGIGCCWAGFLTRIAGSHAPVRKLLNLPHGYSMRGGLMVGESKYIYKRVPPRKALSVQWN